MILSKYDRENPKTYKSRFTSQQKYRQLNYLDQTTDKLIRKYPANRRSGIINKLLSVDRSVMTKEQINTLIEEIEGKRANVDIIQAFEDKKTNEEISQQFSVSQETVRQWRKLYGYSKPNGKKMSDEQLLQALGDGKTNKEIAEMFEITTGAVSKRVKKMTT